MRLLLRPIPRHFSKCGAKREAAISLLQFGHSHSLFFHWLYTWPNMSTPGWSTISGGELSAISKHTKEENEREQREICATHQTLSCSLGPFHPRSSSPVSQPDVPQNTGPNRRLPRARSRCHGPRPATRKTIQTDDTHKTNERYNKKYVITSSLVLSGPDRGISSIFIWKSVWENLDSKAMRCWPADLEEKNLRAISYKNLSFIN